MMRRIIALIIICLIFTACGKSDTQKSREAWNNRTDTDIVIGLTYPVEKIESSTHFYDGICMAVEEVNEKGVLGKKIRLLKIDDEGSVTTGAEVAQSFVDNPEVSAVIGHWNSRVSNAVADIYNRNGLVMLTPASTSPVLTSQGYNYIFSLIRDDTYYGNAMASYAAKTGLDKVVIFYAEDDYGRGLANAFEDAAYEKGIEVVDRTVSINNKNIMNLIDRWKALDYNAVFIADTLEPAEKVIKTIKNAGAKVPIIGATGIDRISFISTIGTYDEGIMMPTNFNPEAEREETKTFVRDFKNKYGYSPDTWAAQGYDCVKVLSYAIEVAGYALPDKIAEQLSKISGYHGAADDLYSNSMGEIIGKKLYIKAVKNGRYEFIDKY